MNGLNTITDMIGKISDGLLSIQFKMEKQTAIVMELKENFFSGESADVSAIRSMDTKEGADAYEILRKYPHALLLNNILDDYVDMSKEEVTEMLKMASELIIKISSIKSVV
jgi:hypothetical protein